MTMNDPRAKQGGSEAPPAASSAARKPPIVHEGASPNDLVLADRKVLLALLQQTKYLVEKWTTHFERVGFPSQWPPDSPQRTPQQEELLWATVATELSIARTQLSLICRLITENNASVPPAPFEDG